MARARAGGRPRGRLLGRRGVRHLHRGLLRVSAGDMRRGHAGRVRRLPRLQRRQLRVPDLGGAVRRRLRGWGVPLGSVRERRVRLSSRCAVRGRRDRALRRAGHVRHGLLPLRLGDRGLRCGNDLHIGGWGAHLRSGRAALCARRRAERKRDRHRLRRLLPAMRGRPQLRRTRRLRIFAVYERDLRGAELQRPRPERRRGRGGLRRRLRPLPGW